ncbi:ABC protein [Mycena sanguinolenta]|uniref:ABC protein n=1 Tax=Mycena sanguinolenta TaxID=230812 RepID=A0A8H6ZDE1_9AGAR|nr:ABC protein [Mycena sanguinolenta]
MPPEICWKCGTPPKPSPTLTALLEPLPSNPSPAMTRLLTSNDIPLDSDIPAIQQIIADDDHRLRALDAEILHLQATLAQLIQKRTETAQHVREHRSIVSVVRRVPPELICEILALSTTPHEETPPWRLGFISRSWRHCAVGYPCLWSFLTVPAYPLKESSITLRLSALQAQLLRCAAAPLDIHWSEVGGTSPDLRFLDLILPHSNRWRAVSFRMTYETSVLNWLEPVRGELDALEKLEVMNACRTNFPDVFATAPKLRHVALPQIQVRNQLPPPFQRTIPIPWAQITHYRGEHPVAQQLEIIQAAPNLLSCTLDLAESHSSFAFARPAHTPVTLPQLRRLGLARHSFLLDIVAPNLEEISSTDGSWATERLLPFIGRASCTLQRLALWNCGFNAALLAVLRSLPSLTSLLLGYDPRHVDDAFFSGMKLEGNTSDVCPHLTTLVYAYGVKESDAFQDSFVLMARSRFQGNPNFRSLRLFSFIDWAKRCGYSFVPVGLAARIRSLQEEGLNVAFLGEEEAAKYRPPRRYIG